MQRHVAGRGSKTRANAIARRDASAGHEGSGPAAHSPWPIRAAVIGATAALLATLGGLYFSGQAVRQSTEQARQTQVAQASERFSRSVEQLGADTVAMRIGGVYSFARLMRDSQTDQEAIVEILSAFVRIQATQAKHPHQRGPRQPAPPDLLAALKVLRGQPQPPPLTQVGVLPSMLLEEVDFSGFDLTSVNLDGAVLLHANLSWTAMAGASLVEVDLRSSNLVQVNLIGAKLSSADLRQAHLNAADLLLADLAGANLRFADLRGANLRNADLVGADLRDADLRLADLGGADLRDADLSHADFRDADLSRAEISAVGLDTVLCTAQTKWPDSLLPGQRPRCTETR
jgi:uncharacterized protein YjbI with pentapeptide repeats